MSTTLIISDLHLGSGNSRAAALCQLLKTPFDRLIINGDTINNLNLRKLKPHHWQAISQLRTIAKERELILIQGNHDGKGLGAKEFGPGSVLPALLGVPLRAEYTVEVGAHRYLVLHGDRFDPTLTWPVVTDTADWFYHAAQKVNRKAAKWLKRKVKKLGGVIEIVKRRAVQHAQQLGYRGVVTGHTHLSENEWIDGVHYINGGCWVDSPCTYVHIDGDQIRLCQWNEAGTPASEPTRELPKNPGRNGFCPHDAEDVLSQLRQV